MLLVKHCPGCGKRSTIEVPDAGYIAWMQGTLYLSEAMPELTPEQRDQVLTGWHPECVQRLESVKGFIDLDYLLDGVPTATVVVLEVDDDPPDGEDQDHDHTEHV
jgi:hypothetical protein